MVSSCVIQVSPLRPLFSPSCFYKRRKKIVLSLINFELKSLQGYDIHVYKKLENILVNPFSFHIQSSHLSDVTVMWSSLPCFFYALDFGSKAKKV